LQDRVFLMKARILALALLPLLLNPLAASAAGGTEIRREAEDHFQVILNRASDRPITLLQVTDLHLGKKDFWRQDLTTFKRIRRLVEMHNPDLIVVTGDLLTGEKYFGSLLAAFAVEFLDSLQRPWVYVFGNHDVEGGFGRDQIYEVFRSSPWCILGSHKVGNQWVKKYDYVVDIKVARQAEPAWQLFGFDSGSEAGFKSIKDDQIAWFKEVSQETKRARGHAVRAVCFFHIPLKQYQELWNDASIVKTGERKEEVSYEEDDGTPYRAFLEMKNIEATFCGHDHYNNFWGKTKDGIILAYGYISGEATRAAWPTGGKLIRLSFKGEPIGIENVRPDFGGK
jgi:3',5'-cyclic AMP phosphodiesterase CpdA